MTFWLGLIIGAGVTFLFLGWAFSQMGVDPVRAEWAIALLLITVAIWTDKSCG